MDKYLQTGLNVEIHVLHTRDSDFSVVCSITKLHVYTVDLFAQRGLSALLGNVNHYFCSFKYCKPMIKCVSKLGLIFYFVTS